MTCRHSWIVLKCGDTVRSTETRRAPDPETHGHVRYVVESSERHLLCEVCSKLEVVQVNQQTVYYVWEFTVYSFYKELNLPLYIEAGKKCQKPLHRHELTVHAVTFETGKGFSVTPSSPVGP